MDKDYHDYSQPSILSDIKLICRDNVTLYFSKWALGRKCPVFEASFNDKCADEIPISDYDSKTVTFVLRRIDNGPLVLSDFKIIEEIRLVYEFSHQYQFEKLELDMQKMLEYNPTIKVLASLKQRKSPSYLTSLRYLMKHGTDAHLDTGDTIPRYICNDIITEFQKLKKDINSLNTDLKFISSGDNCYITKSQYDNLRTKLNSPFFL